MTQWKNTHDSYGAVAKALHWTLAVMVIFMLGFGFWMDTQEPPFKFELYGIHKSTGIAILFLVALRLIWRAMNVNPVLPADFPPVLRIFVRMGHYALYVALIAMPLIGWGMSSAGGHPVSFFGLFTLPPLVPENKQLGALFIFWGAWILIAMITGHVFAALYHHFIRKDNILRRMLPCGGKCL